MTDEPKTQLDKFKEAARDLGCDDDEARFDERVKKLVKQKPGENPAGELGDFTGVTRDGG
ncbi:hypothetical protein [Sphingomonas sp. SRS2]|uniref:hypothetical protein n=1 Tax=Sphingomonas sp. SRS2 TaxID=133190 RepID=UPI0006184E4D|nr:hypothetical protein [Sphingomonas sp. SRS2]KKC27240.1 hypothetical protein WP12_04105 [Sphingomonas sp. SRS2]